MRLKGKVAVITGGSGLLGSQFAEALIKEGASVWILDLKEPPITLLSSKKIGFVKTDISSKLEVETAKRLISENSKRVDILINCAALTSETAFKKNPGYFNKFENYPLELWKLALDINLTGTFLCCQEFGKIMLKQGSGVIINVASNYGMLSPDFRTYEGCINPNTGKPFTTPIAYAATKAAILNMTRYLACYWGKKGIRVNSITPSAVKTNMDPKFVKNYTRNLPIGRMAKPDEYNKAIIFLASDDSKFMTGANLVVDGGWTAW